MASARGRQPYLALETIRLLTGIFFFNYIFSDNLSRPFRPVNAALLLPPTPLKPEKVDKSTVTDELTE
jgi:hypothetical protein